MVATVFPVQKPPKVHIFRTNTVHWFFKVLLCVCQFFCAAPLLNCTKYFLIKLHFVWSILMALAIVTASCSMEEILDVEMSTIKKALLLSEYFSDTGLVLLTIITCYYYKNCYETFPKRIQELERRTQIYQQKVFHQRTAHKVYKKIMIVAVIGAIFFTATTFIDFFYNAENYLLFIRSSTVYILPNVTISLWIGQYWVLLKFIISRYEVLNCILDELNGHRIHQTSCCSLLAEVIKGHGNKARLDAATILDDLRNIFAHLETLVGDVNAVFGLTITANFLASFLTLSMQIFVLYKLPEKTENFNWSSVLYALFWIALNSLKFVVILQANSCLLNVKSQTGIILNDFYAADIKTEDAINRFLMQLVVKNNVQMACGIVELDMELIGGVMSALSIYVIFLIQVDLGELILITRPTPNATISQTMQ